MPSTAAAASPSGDDPLIVMEDVNKWYGAYHALRDVNLSVRRGEKIVLCGPSGSGKSTLIRCVNHLETIKTGRITVDGVRLDDSTRSVDAVRSEVGISRQKPCRGCACQYASLAWRVVFCSGKRMIFIWG